MNAIKNILILAVLAMVGYGVYTSLARNNLESEPPPGAAPQWAVAPQVEVPRTAAAAPQPAGNGPLALSSSPAPTSPSVSPGFQMGEAPPSLAPESETSQPKTPAAPDVSSEQPATAMASASPSPAASLGAPVAAEAAPSTVGAPTQNSTLSSVVRNLAPPPGTVAADNPADALLRSKFAAFMDAVHKNLEAGKLAEAHLALSTLYGNPDLPAELAKEITRLLDQLAGTVIYSRKHYLEPAYVTRPGDTLESIARQYNVPWQLLGRINGLVPATASNQDDPLKDQPIPAGMELKVVRGPFEAVVRLDRRELVLLVQNRYAGRFPIGIGKDQPQLDGSYTVMNKVPQPTYNAPDGKSYPPRDPNNPLGEAWIGLSDRVGIHGAGSPEAIGRDDNRGSICVGPRDLDDLYGILSVGSRVTVLR